MSRCNCTCEHDDFSDEEVTVLNYGIPDDEFDDDLDDLDETEEETERRTVMDAVRAGSASLKFNNNNNPGDILPLPGDPGYLTANSEEMTANQRRIVQEIADGLPEAHVYELEQPVANRATKRRR